MRVLRQAPFRGPLHVRATFASAGAAEFAVDVTLACAVRVERARAGLAGPSASDASSAGRPVPPASSKATGRAE